MYYCTYARYYYYYTVVSIIRAATTQYQMTVSPSTPGFIHMDGLAAAGLAVIISYTISYISSGDSEGRASLFREFNSIMIIEKPIGGGGHEQNKLRMIYRRRYFWYRPTCDCSFLVFPPRTSLSYFEFFFFYHGKPPRPPLNVYLVYT